MSVFLATSWLEPGGVGSAGFGEGSAAAAVWAAWAEWAAAGRAALRLGRACDVGLATVEAGGEAQAAGLLVGKKKRRSFPISFVGQDRGSSESKV